MDQRKTGPFIAARRRSLGLTQAQLAEKLHVSNRTISKWETGAGFPDVSILESLADALEVSVSELLRGEAAESHVESDLAVREVVRVLGSSFKMQMRRLRRLAGSCVLLLFLLTIGQGVVEFLATNGDGYDNGINARNTRIGYENDCRDFASQGVYRMDIRVEDAEYSITDPEALECVVELLVQTELGREYQDWGPQSLVYSLRVYTSGWTPDDRFIDTENSWFELTYPAFSIQRPTIPAPDLEPENEVSFQVESEDDVFYFDAEINGTDAWSVIESVLTECAVAALH